MHLNMNRVEKYLRYNILIKLMIEFPCARGTIKKLRTLLKSHFMSENQYFWKDKRILKQLEKKAAVNCIKWLHFDKNQVTKKPNSQQWCYFAKAMAMTGFFNDLFAGLSSWLLLAPNGKLGSHHPNPFTLRLLLNIYCLFTCDYYLLSRWPKTGTVLGCSYNYSFC